MQEATIFDPRLLSDLLRERDEPGLVKAVDAALDFIVKEPDRCWDAASLIDAVSAADLVAAAGGRAPPELPAQEAAWLTARQQIASPDRITAAVSAVEKLRASDYLAEVVFASDPAEWEKIFEEVLGRLRPPRLAGQAPLNITDNEEQKR